MSALLSHITRELLGKLENSFKLPAPGLQFSNPLQSFCSVSNSISPKAHDFCQKKHTLPEPPSGLTL
jgi:hypothetical protein